ncbi:hypothetical protein K8I31_07025 [bacterium]|nr:hypothetical protein [bacterium]
MTRFTPFILAILCAISSYAQPTFTYVGEFPTNGEGLAVAADANGGLYYTVFTFSGPNATRCYYVAEPFANGGVESHVLVADAAETDVPAGRGFTGVAVDRIGNVYLALESGSADTANVRKLSPAPDFEPVADFFDGIVYGGKRYNSVEIMDDDTLILTTFNTIEFWDANDSTPLHAVSGLEAYQRDAAFNPSTNDIYTAKNGSELSNSVNRLSGGSSDDPTAYTEIINGFIPQGGVNSTYGRNSQLIEYDPALDLIFIPDYSGEQPVIAVYDPTDPSAYVASMDGSESPNGAFGAPSDCVVIGDFVYVVDNEGQRILIYSTYESAVSDWALSE